MVSQRSQGVVTVAASLQLLLVSALFWGWLFLWEGTVAVTQLSLGSYLLCNEVLVVGILLASGGSGGVWAWTSRGRDGAIRVARRQFVFSMFGVAAVLAALSNHEPPYAMFAGFAPLFYGVLRGANVRLPTLVARWCFAGSEPERVALVGTPDRAEAIEQWLSSKRLLGLEVQGLLLSDAKPEAGPDLPRAGGRLPVLGSVAELSTLRARYDLQQVLVLGLAWPPGFFREIVNRCEREGLRLWVASDLDEQFCHPVTMFDDGGVQLIGLRREPLENPLNRLAKRVLDLMLALPAVLLLLPPAALVAWLLQRWQSPGPLFFRQQRSGLRGRSFAMIKFRTMTVENDDETRQVRLDDPRVFAAGRWMRRLSFDELPQFLNVLRGDMSIVGPRPHLRSHDDLFIEAMNAYRVRSAVKPGITGLAQVRGFRGGTPTSEDVRRRVASDIEYLERWTLSLDLWIILRTGWQVFFPPPSAY